MESILTPVKAIRAFCVSCKGKVKSMSCDKADCPLYPYHTGHKPESAKRQMTAEQKEAAARRLAAARQK